jgi:predicted NUDIX family NTP pyrophosphohydrolase
LPVPSKSKVSAGVLLFRQRGGGLEVLLVHPGGPFWSRKDAGAWSIPKGLVDDAEDELTAGRREFAEETGHDPVGAFFPLGSLKQPGGKTVCIWAVEGDWDPTLLVSNSFSMEWPKGSGKLRAFPEVDKAEWFSLDAARSKILKGQAAFLDRLASRPDATARSSGR